jgi:hypothetical protein
MPVIFTARAAAFFGYREKGITSGNKGDSIDRMTRDQELKRHHDAKIGLEGVGVCLYDSGELASAGR